MMYPLVLDLAADKIPITVTCRVLGFSTQAFYAWKSNPISQRDWDDAHVTNAAIDIHHDDPAFGYRFIVDELSTRGIAAGQNRVARLCSQQRIWSVFAKRRGPSRKAGPPVHDDLVDRQFNAAAPNLLWLTDITEHPTGEGKLYLCAITDVHSNRIVGYSIDSRMKASLAVAALRNAIGLRNPAGTIVHSDRGSPVPVQRLRPHAQEQRPARLDGQSRCMRGQRRDGVVLLAAAKERPGPPTLDDQRRTAAGDHHLDRTHLPPPTPATTPRQAHPDRV
jgi:transposase InsO family protein